STFLYIFFIIYDPFCTPPRSLSDLARYFSSGTREVEEFYHYGLAVPYYTHFTSAPPLLLPPLPLLPLLPPHPSLLPLLILSHRPPSPPYLPLPLFPFSFCSPPPFSTSSSFLAHLSRLSLSSSSSPIRRYADMIVHRLLLSGLEREQAAL